MGQARGGCGLTDDPSPSRSARARARKRRRKLRNRRYYERRKNRLNKTLRQHAIAGYDGFVRALIARRKALGWTQLELDERAGFQPGYAGKLEAWQGPQGRTAGSVTMGLWLAALGVSVVVVPTLDGPVRDQARALAAIVRPRLNGAELTQRVPPRPASRRKR